VFFPEKMQRIRLLVHQSVNDQAVKKLHELGVMQITDFRDKHNDDEWRKLLSVYSISPNIRLLMTQSMSINRLLDIFTMVDAEKREGFFKSLFSPTPPVKISMVDLSGEALLDEVASTLADVGAEVSGPWERLQALQAETAELAPLKEVYERISSLPVPFEMLGSGPMIHMILGVALKKDWTQLLTELESATNGICAFFVNDLSETEHALLVISRLEDSDQVFGCFRKWDIERVPPNRFKGMPAQVLAQIDARLDAIERERCDCYARISVVAGGWRLRLQALRELLTIERERAEVHANFARTDQVIAIEGWVTTKRAGDVVAAMENSCGGLVTTMITEPDEPADNLPVALNNPGFLKHFELLVKLYASPRYNEIDPTILICPTFLLFFGLMMTDVIYGVTTLLLGAFILRGGGKYYPLYHSIGILLILGGISTIVLGVLTGGWLGNLATHYLDLQFLKYLVVINPMVDVSVFLIMAMAIGLLHLNIGAVLNIVKNIRNAQIIGVSKFVWFFLLEIALVLYYYQLTGLAMVFGIAGLLFLIYAEKGMALFGITGLAGDCLSYARLMAIGLVSFGLAIAINALAMMVWDVSYIGWFLGTLILLAGHSFSYLLNLMGAFAHAIRLHFVEFFGKFYSGGGEDFKPFRIQREVTIQP
jgi:V/A-type H+/Na+-transporting ATPase subunit I